LIQVIERTHVQGSVLLASGVSVTTCAARVIIVCVAAAPGWKTSPVDDQLDGWQSASESDLQLLQVDPASADDDLAGGHGGPELDRWGGRPCLEAAAAGANLDRHRQFHEPAGWS